MKIEKLLSGEDYHARDYTEQSDDDVVEVCVESIEKGEVTVYLPEGMDVEIANDEPSKVTVTAL